MSKDNKDIYTRSEGYKVGWVHGFYDAVPDDGAFHGGSVWRGIASTTGATRSYNSGYWDGMAARRAGNSRRLKYLLAEQTKIAVLTPDAIRPDLQNGDEIETQPLPFPTSLAS